MSLEFPQGSLAAMLPITGDYKMKKFKVQQVVLCEVSVWFTVQAESHTEALELVAQEGAPTSRSIMDGADYEITSDNNILKTLIEEV